MCFGVNAVDDSAASAVAAVVIVDGRCCFR